MEVMMKANSVIIKALQQQEQIEQQQNPILASTLAKILHVHPKISLSNISLIAPMPTAMAPPMIHTKKVTKVHIQQMSFETMKCIQKWQSTEAENALGFTGEFQNCGHFGGHGNDHESKN